MSFAHLLRKVDFDAIVDHLTITHIMKSKVEPVTTRIKSLLELLNFYSFNLYYIKGKDMVLSDFLLRQRTDDINSHEIILISFNMRKVLWEKYYKLGNMIEEDQYLVQTRSNGVKLPEVHGIEKSLVPHIKPESQKTINQPTDKRPPIPKPRLWQGRAGIRRKARVVLPTQTPIQTPAPNVAPSLPESVIQSQERM